MRVWDEGANFHDLVMKDIQITDKLSREELDELFDISKQLRNVDKIFKRVFGECPLGAQASLPAVSQVMKDRAGKDACAPRTMKARIYVTLKPSVLDPQGKAIHHAVETIGYRGIKDVRQGKYFEVTVDDSLSAEEAREHIQRMASDVLANPVIEDYRVELDE